MDSSIQPLDIENDTDPFEQPAELVRQGLNRLHELYDQQRSEIERLLQEANWVQAELAAARQAIVQLEAASTTAQAASEPPPTYDVPIPTGPRARRENAKLRNQIKQLQAELTALQGETAEPAEIKSLRDERDQLKTTIEQIEARLLALQTELDTAQQQLKAREQELETKRKEIFKIHRGLEKSRKSLDQARRSLDRERATNRELRQALAAATQNEEAILRDLEICKSSRDQLAKQVEDLQLTVRKGREQSGWEVATRLTAVLTKLSALANLEPDQVLGLSQRAVFEEFRTELGRAAGGRLEPYPGRLEMVDNMLWLDADQSGLEVLQARYDWSPDHPFERLPPGSRRIPFRLSRRGWSVGDRVLQRARVVPVPMEQGLTADLQPEEPPVYPGGQPDELDAGQVQG